ncbi:tyrosine-type recombinase/integrase [Nonomuraea sp. NPDC050328]|uniref:tyrosine-type recombinase/integrase n=1 Tax=Nonomuraea sp. NPDC050328 TaxID=3364361 RepID=UPI0037A39D6D
MTENVIEFPHGGRTTRPRRRTAAVPESTPLTTLIDSWELALLAANKATATIQMYVRVARRFVAYLNDTGQPAEADSVGPDQIRGFLVHERERAGLPTSASAHAYLGVWFTWLISDGARTLASPVLKDDRPHLPSKARKYLTLEEVGALLATCNSRDFADLRDAAIIRVLLDNGVRLSGLVGLRRDDVDLRGRRLRVTLKGGDEHWVPIGHKTVQAIDRYLRARSRHARADVPWLWLGIRGYKHPRLRQAGVQDMLKRRGAAAGVENVHPHRFRGTSAHEQLEAGAHPDNVRRNLGWKSDRMLRHYTEELSNERARAAHLSCSPSDRV